MAVVPVTGRAKAAKVGKRLVADIMFAKGAAFLGSAVLLRSHRGPEHVVLHLMCQGIEVALKGLLLRADFDRYWPQLKRDFGHNLVRLADEASEVYGQRVPGDALRGELQNLNDLYSKHLLRYASIHDIFIAGSSIPSSRVLRCITAVLRLEARKRP